MDPGVAEAVWKAIQGHLPPRPPDNHPLGCHRLRISDRDCLDAILARLVTGCSWDVAARLCKASETTLRGRRTEWLTAGVRQTRRRSHRRLRQDHRPWTCPR
jgi:transposase